MPQQNPSRFSRMVSLFDSLKRGRDRRRRNLAASLTPASESLESRTLLTGVGLERVTFESPLHTTIRPDSGSSYEYVRGELAIESGSDVVISWNPLLASKDFDIRIYHIDTGQEVVNENHLTSASFVPEGLTEPGRYQVFIRHTDVNDQTGDWVSPTYFRLSIEAQTGAVDGTSFIGVTNGPDPALTWTAVNQIGYTTTYEVVVYNVAAGQEVLRESYLTETSLSVASLLESGDEFQAFVRTQQTNVLGNVAFDVYQFPYLSDWSAPFHFQGEGAPTVPSAAVVDVENRTVEWEPIAGAVSYDVVIYNTWTGKEVDHLTGLTDLGLDLTPYEITVNPGLDSFHAFDYQLFYRARFAEAPIGLWSSPVVFQRPLNILPLESSIIPDSNLVENRYGSVAAHN